MSTFFKYGLRFGLVLALLLLLSIGAAGLILAGPPVGNPADAIPIDNQLHTIAPNSVVWYRFEYLGDGSKLSIRIPSVAKSGPVFELYTPEGINTWWKADPIGASSDDEADHVWFGNFNIGGVYYLKVINELPYALPYQLLVTGKGVVTGKTVLPTTTVSEPAPKVLPPEGNIDPNKAVKFDTQLHTVPANTALWYRIEYGGKDAPFFVKMVNGAKSGLKFEVYANEQIAAWWKADPTGMGTKDGDDLLWGGYAQSDITYYLRIINDTGNPLNFQFTMQTMAGPR